MTNAKRNLIHLWDYGWLDCDEVTIPRCDHVADVIAAYIRSDDFGMSFVGPMPDAMPDLHGPFRRSAIADEDFLPITSSQFGAEVHALRQPTGFSSPANDDQWHAVETAAAELERNHKWIIMLRFNEQNRDKFHDWGHVLEIFREFLFANPQSERLSRFIIGYD